MSALSRRQKKGVKNMNELLAEMQEMFNGFMIQVDNFIAEW